VFKLPELPYAYDALEPIVSAETMHLHHDKHHQTYFTNTNKMLDEAGLRPRTLEEVVVEAKQAGRQKLKNNAGQAWNHTFFWTCMSPEKQSPEGELKAAIDQAFGGLEQLKARFVEEGAGHFGSGWVWLVARGSSLEVNSTHDGDNHLGEDGVTPLIVCDLWEHAYYVDYRNDRKSFLEKWFDALPNWSFAAEQLAAARGTGEAWKHPEAEAAQSAAA
jgi:Fe-Mn family superoxide dismutase